jgi:hypothetical protein
MTSAQVVRHSFYDEAEPTRLTFYAPMVVGETQRLTPEGFLVCEAVPIARVGEMLYAAGEVPVDPSGDGIIRVTRDEDQVFRPETMASFMGKPVTNDHPDEDVTPINWRTLAVGVVNNVRRGDGDMADFLLADLIIQDASAIDDVKSGKREVSCGYEADYEQIEPGRGRQLNIIGNHVALVEQGRCGPRCAIGDKRTIPVERETPMVKRTVWDRIRTAFKANDEAAFNEEMDAAQKAADDGEDAPQRIVIEVKQAKADEAEPEATTEDDGDPDAETGVAAQLAALAASIEAIGARLAKIEAGPSTEATSDEDSEEGDKEDEEKDDKSSAKTGDSASLKTEFTDTLARAEILAPGVKLPTFDAKSDPKKTTDSMCALRRKALGVAFKNDGMRKHLSPFVTSDSADFAKMTCDAVKLIFNGSSELAKIGNNGGAATRDRATRDDDVHSITAINKRNADFWNRK